MNNSFRVYIIGIILILFVSNASAATLSVCSSGCDYSNIQAAIDAASPGDTINVLSSTYHENIIIDKSITLLGENRNTTVIDGLGNSDVVLITKNNTNFSGFKVISNGFNSPSLFIGIKLLSVSNSIVSNNNVSNNNYGIALWTNSSNNLIENNIVTYNNAGIVIADHSTKNTIRNNTASFNFYHGINPYLDSNENFIIGNIVLKNGYYGIIPDSSHDNIITENYISGNSYGIYTYSYFSQSGGNLIFNNNFVENINQAYDDSGLNFWNNSIIGNYWNDFDEPDEGCYDVDTNNICDSSYSIPISNKDSFPLVTWDITPPTISILSPTNGLTFTNASITVSGTAFDNIGLSKVEVKVGSGSWEQATGTISWIKSITLTSGSNMIYAKATDISGNTNETSVTVNYEIPDNPPFILFLVKDNETGIPIKDAIVQVSSSYKGKTNETGGIAFSSSYQYMVKKGGYFNASGTINIVRDIIVDVKLVPRR